MNTTNKKTAVAEEYRFSVERNLSGVLLRITDGTGKEIMSILLPFQEAEKLGRLLISNAKTGMLQTELLVKKMAELEQEIRKLENKLRDLSKKVEKVEQLEPTQSRPLG